MMYRVLFALLLVFLLTACSEEPRKMMLPTDISLWETDADFQDALSQLTLEEQNLLSTYLIRIEAEQLAGNPPPRQMTIGEAVHTQQLWVDQFQERQRIERRKLQAEKTYLRDYLTLVEVTGFQVVEQILPGSKTPQVCFVGTITNKGDKPLSEVQLTVSYLDKFGHDLSTVQYMPVASLSDSDAGQQDILPPSGRTKFTFPAAGEIPPDWNGMASAIVTAIEFKATTTASHN